MSAESVHTIPVELFCRANNHTQKRKACNLSFDGLFILGSPCPKDGTEFDITIKTAMQKYPLQLSTYVVSPGSDGFTLCYSSLSEQDRLTLDYIIRPKWDGHSLLEGLLIFSAFEQVTDLAGWLRLTSLIDNQHQSLCAHHSQDNLYKSPVISPAGK